MKKLLPLFCALIMLSSIIVGCAAPAAIPAATPAAVTTADNSDTSLEDIKTKGYFTVGLDDSFPPMGYRDESDEIVGFDIDLARAVAKEMGVEVKFQPVAWESIDTEINSKRVDVIWNGCTITDERKAVFDFSDPYMLNTQIVVVLADSSYQTLADLSGKVAGIQDGSSANIALDSNPEFKDSLASISGYPSNDKALTDLAAGRTDCVVVDVCVFGYYFQIQPGTYRALDESLGSEEFGIAFHQEADAFREGLQTALDAVIASGEATEISMKWFDKDVIAK